MSGRKARQERRSDPARRATAEAAAATIGAGGACPDCDAETRLVDTGGGVFVLQVLHDDTCPELARREGRR